MRLIRIFNSAIVFAMSFGYLSADVSAQDRSRFFAGVSAGFSACPTGFPGEYDRGQPAFGGDWGASIGWISRAKVGAGIIYSGFTSTASQDVRYSMNGNSGFLNVDLRFLVDYLAPQVIYQTNIGKHGWYFNASAGAGIMFLKETASMKENGVKVSTSDSKSGFGWNVNAGFGYTFNEHVSFTTGLGYTYGAIKTYNELHFLSYHSDFFSRVNLDLGLRYTF